MSLRRTPAKPATQYTGDALPTPRTAALLDTSAVSRLVVPLPKPLFLRSKKYLRWTATLPCANCGIEGYSNACHADEGKGMGMKACDSTVWPGCVTRYGRVGCHDIFGASGLIGKTERRSRERSFGRETRAKAKAVGMYPKGWP